MEEEHGHGPLEDCFPLQKQGLSSTCTSMFGGGRPRLAGHRTVSRFLRRSASAPRVCGGFPQVISVNGMKQYETSGL